MRIDTNIIFAVPITRAEIIVELGPRGCIAVALVYLPRGSATVSTFHLIKCIMLSTMKKGKRR